MEKKIKLMIWADSPTIPTGWGNVVRFNLKYLPQYKYDISIIGINYRGDPHDLPYRIYPPATIHPEDLYGFLRLQEILQREKPDIIWIINDIWVINNMLSNLKNIKFESLPKIVTYFPVDAKEHDPDWYKNLDITSARVVYNQFGHEVAKKASPDTEFKIIGHGVDNSIFKKLFPDRKEAKKHLFLMNKEIWDSFIFLNASRNQPRKRIDITMEAFALFSANKSKEETALYLHCGVQDAHINILKLAKRLGIDNKLIITTGNSGIQAVSFEMLNKIYNACEVGINSGIGEGFGLPNAEHAITGAPQIVPDHSSLGELYKDCGLLIQPTMNYMIDKIMTVGKLIKPEDLADAMNKLYLDRDLYKELSEKSVQKFTSYKYSWQNIANQWDQLFMSLL